MSKRKNVTAKVWNQLFEAERELLFRSISVLKDNDVVFDDYSTIRMGLYVALDIIENPDRDVKEIIDDRSCCKKAGGEKHDKDNSDR